jgi:hypothetical protein
VSASHSLGRREGLPRRRLRFRCVSSSRPFGDRCGKRLDKPDNPFVDTVTAEDGRVSSHSFQNIGLYGDMSFVLRVTRERSNRNCPWPEGERD